MLDETAVSTRSDQLPTVTIIVNNYNYASFIRDAIDTSLEQSYPRLEVIVVDDGSTDDSVEIIHSYGDRIIPVLKPNGGQASAMNAGFQVSRGDLVIFLDADDYLFPQAVENIVEAWQPGAVQLQSRLETVDAQGRYIDLYPAPEIRFDRGNVQPLLLKRGRYNCTVTSGNCFSRAVLEKILPIPEADFRISADGYLVTVAPLYGEVIALETSVGARRKHGDNLWALSGAGLKVEQFRKSFHHDFLRHKYLIATATQLGHSVSPHIGLGDYLHVQDRLVSLRFDPSTHPIPDDTRLSLARRGFWAIWQASPFSWTRKCILSLWFLWVGVAPQPWAMQAITWKFAGKARPRWADYMLKRLRFSTR
ncbi:MAG: glycosyltransferase [Leptolyngbyaceae cyanobacterium SL_7_1]|nr:glycosyltransferase [Leptolyngbyaceae cyanobacterium SL_7_1]